jgi:site-specific DNA-methyltransferase (adenine-specific)
MAKSIKQTNPRRRHVDGPVVVQSKSHPGVFAEIVPTAFPYATPRTGTLPPVPQEIRGKSRLIFVDPPYGFGRDYEDGGVGDSLISDREEYRRFTDRLLSFCVATLAPGGALWLMLPPERVAYADEQLSANLGWTRRNWIIWHYRFGQHRYTNFVPSHVHLLYYVRPGGDATWNGDQVLEPSVRLLGGDKRTSTASRLGMRPFMDVWYGRDLGRVQGNNDERWVKAHGATVDHDNQVPETLLFRVIKACSNPGDLVVDPCVGSGTTGVCALAIGRNFHGYEINAKIAASAAKRIARGPARNPFATTYRPPLPGMDVPK